VAVRVDDDGTSTVSVARVAAGMVRDLFRVRRWGSEGLYDLDPSEVEVEGG
jgi:hypothetical protein